MSYNKKQNSQINEGANVGQVIDGPGNKFQGVPRFVGVRDAAARLREVRKNQILSEKRKLKLSISLFLADS